MPAAEATILAFPTQPRMVQGELELGREHRVDDIPPPGRAGGGLAPLALRAASGLLLLVPPLLLPGHLDANDVATLALAVMLATLVAAIASLAPLVRRKCPVGVALALIVVAAGAAGRAGLVGIGLLALIEASRALLRGPSPLDALLLAAGTAVRLDLGAVLAGATLPPTLAAAGLLLGLFAGLLPAPEHRVARPRSSDELWREVALLGLMAGAVSFYAAALLAGPAAHARAGVLALLSVPALLGCLLRLWWVTRLREAVRAARLARLSQEPLAAARP